MNLNKNKFMTLILLLFLFVYFMISFSSVIDRNKAWIQQTEYELLIKSTSQWLNDYEYSKSLYDYIEDSEYVGDVKSFELFVNTSIPSGKREAVLEKYTSLVKNRPAIVGESYNNLTRHDIKQEKKALNERLPFIGSYLKDHYDVVVFDSTGKVVFGGEKDLESFDRDKVFSAAKYESNKVVHYKEYVIFGDVYKNYYIAVIKSGLDLSVVDFTKVTTIIILVLAFFTLVIAISRSNSQIILTLSLIGIIFTFTVVSTAINRDYSESRYKLMLKNEIANVMQKNLMRDRFMDTFTKDAIQHADYLLYSLLTIERIKAEMGIMGEYQDVYGKVEIRTVPKGELLTSTKYRSILDNFTTSPVIKYFSIKTENSDGTYTIRRAAFAYLPEKDVVMIAEKSLNTQFVVKDHLLQDLNAYSLISDKNTLSDIMIFDKNNALISDNHHIFKEDTLHLDDIGAGGKYFELNYDKGYNVARLGYILEDQTTGHKMIALIKKEDYLRNDDPFVTEMQRSSMALFIMAIVLLIINRINNTKKMLA